MIDPPPRVLKNTQQGIFLLSKQKNKYYYKTKR